MNVISDHITDCILNVFIVCFFAKNIYNSEQHQVANKYISFNKTRVSNICGLNLKSNSENMLAFELISRAH